MFGERRGKRKREREGRGITTTITQACSRLLCVTESVNYFQTAISIHVLNFVVGGGMVEGVGVGGGGGGGEGGRGWGVLVIFTSTTYSLDVRLDAPDENLSLAVAR